MEHRHLLPDEIDLLVDGDVGFGIAPLQAHVDRCERCRAELEAMRDVVQSLEELPHLTPSPLFSERVMAQVQVFEPWHVAATDAVRRFVPRSAPARVTAAAMFGVAALVLSVSAVWLGVRADAFLFFFNIAADRARRTVFDVASSTLSDLLGPSAVDALRSSGATGALVALTGFLLALIVAAVGLRVLAGVSRRRRS